MTPEMVTAVASVFISTCSLVYVVLSTRRTSITQTITSQRIDWIKQTREALLDFAHCYRLSDKNGMAEAKARIESLMRRDKKGYWQVLTHLDLCIKTSYTEKDYEKLMGLNAYILARAWQRIKLDGETILPVSNKRQTKTVTRELEKLKDLALTGYFDASIPDEE